MSGLEESLTDIAIVFTLVLSRVSGLVATGPLLSNASMPMRVRALLAVALAGVMTPICLSMPRPTYTTLIDLGASAATEVVVGVTLGLGLMVILGGAQLAGQIVGQMSGMALAEGADPAFGSNASIFGQVFYFVTMALFIAMGGHRMTIEALLTTYDHAPPGKALITDKMIENFLGLISVGFELGIRSAAPLVVALFLATLILGLVSRTLPQINTIAVGFGINAMLLLGIMMASIGAVAWAYQGPLNEALVSLSEATATADPPAIKGGG